ncbi:hypothetical protein BD560DRAFT_407242 [Blakeslea trispora]|nr:hypothetical protein BD560DRAFT_407242 [Blakeslea trispora]
MDLRIVAAFFLVITYTCQFVSALSIHQAKQELKAFPLTGCVDSSESRNPFCS